MSGERAQQQHPAAANRTASVEKSKTETVYAWICTSDTCNAWQRIKTFEEAELPKKECPLCKAPMEKGSKKVTVTT